MENISWLRSKGIDFAIFVMGFTSLSWQFIIVREMLVTFHGNEFTIGIIFANWLLLEAVGCYLWRRKAESLKKPLVFFISIQLLIGFLALLSVTLLRSTKYFFEIPLGEVLGLHIVALISLVILAPVSISKGALFPLASRNLGMIKNKSNAASEVYLIEAIGSFVAGLIFIFYLIERFDHFTIITIIFLLNTLSVVIILHSQKIYSRIKYLTLAFGLLILSAAIFSSTKWLNEKTSQLLWYEYSLLTTENSVYSNIAVIESENEFTFFQNGAPFITIPSPLFFVEEKAHIPLLLHPQPENVLLIGRGVGGLVNEILKHPVTNIKYAEQDPLVIELTKKFLTPLTESEINSDKFSVVNIEGRRFVKTSDNKYDCILITLPIPTTLQLNRFFTVEFFEILKSRLNKNGITAISVAGSETFLTDELEKLNNTIYRTLKSAFPFVRVVVGEMNIFIASNEKLIFDDVAILKQRLTERNIQAGLINEFYLDYKFDESRFKSIEAAIIKGDNAVLNSDKTPTAVFQSLLFHTSIVSPTLVDILKTIDSIPISLYILTLIVILVGLIISQLKRKNNLYIDTAILTTGFTSIVIYLLLIFYFQIYFGNVYHYVGLLTAFFMLGSAVGAYFGKKRRFNNLVKIESGFILLIVALSLFTLIEVDIALMQIIIFSTMILVGALTGFEFPIAVKKYQDVNDFKSQNSSKLYSLDLFGAFFGALLTGVVFVPTIGIAATLILLLLIKIGSVSLVLIGKKVV